MSQSTSYCDNGLEPFTVEEITNLKRTGSLTVQQRIEIKGRGRPTPALSLCQETSSKGKKILPNCMIS